jgi:ParB-like chromosome segregation protein Spo0J
MGIQEACKLPEWINDHPVNNVIWVNSEYVYANDYNPNAVAKPEMELLELSIKSDGFTQPIVVWKVDNNKYEVVDGFHRHLIGKKLNMELLPVVIINNDRIDRGDRIAATIRHNRARGKHKVESMSDIVLELSRRNWSNKRIAKELGMDADEVLRLKQITGLAELFQDEEFSEAWEAE